MEINKSETFSHWENWKGTLAKAVSLAEMVGMSDKTVEKIGVQIGSILAAAIDPENREQRLLQELWKVGDDKERAVLTRMLIKMIQTDIQH